MPDQQNEQNEQNEQIHVTVVNVGNARQVPVEAGSTVADALAKAGIDPDLAIRFRGESIDSEQAVALILTPGEVITAASPNLGHG